MFCKKCGAQLEEGAVFCQNCGNKIDENIPKEKKEPENQKKTLKKKKMSVKKWLLVVLGLLAVSIIGSTLFGSNNTGEETSEYIAMVQEGYLGEFTDATVKEIFDDNFSLTGMHLDWTCAEIDGVPIVGFHAYLDGESIEDATAVLFEIHSNETFKVAGYAEGENEGFEMTEIADRLNYWYLNWYVKNKIGIDASEEEIMYGMQTLIRDKFDKISGSAVLYGAAKEYAGDRSELSKEIDGSEPLGMSVTELINYYGDNILDIYTAGTDEWKEEAEENSTEDGSADANIYGIYSVDNGVDAVLSAEVGIYTDSGLDYIRMEALSYGDRYLAEFDGNLIQTEGNVYKAVEESGNTVLNIVLDTEGMKVSVEFADLEDYYYLEGYYPKIEEFNMDEVG